CWFGYSYSIDIAFKDSASHQTALYLLDFDSAGGGRNQTVQIIDGNSGNPLDTRTVTGFYGGVYLVWNLSGHVVVKITNVNNAANAVMSGLFFGGPTTSAPVSTAASFVKTDLTTAGNWHGVYGADGYNVLGDLSSIPGYVTVAAAGYSSYTWSNSTSDPRALQK